MLPYILGIPLGIRNDRMSSVAIDILIVVLLNDLPDATDAIDADPDADVFVLRSVNAENKVVGGSLADTVTLKCHIKGVPSNGVLDSGAGCSLTTSGFIAKVPNVKLRIT